MTTNITNEVEETKEKEMMDIVKGSIVNSHNKSNGTDNWCLVLGCMENRDAITAIRLTDDEKFKYIDELKVSTDIFGEFTQVYANPFNMLNLKLEWITEVRKPIGVLEYFNIINVIVSYFADFVYLDDNGFYRVNTPYIRNPILTMMMGLQSIDDARTNEAQHRIKMIERNKKKEEQKLEKISSTIRSAPKQKRDSLPTITMKQRLDSLDIYGLHTSDRIHAIYKFFENYLTPDGKLSIKKAYSALFENATIRKMKKGATTVSQEEFAFIVNSEVNAIKDKLGINSLSNSYDIKRKAIAIFEGSDYLKTDQKKEYDQNLFDRIESILQSYEGRPNKSAILKDLKEEFDISDTIMSETYDAVRVYIDRKKRKIRNVYRNHKDDKVLNVCDTRSITHLKDKEKVFELIAKYNDLSKQIHSGNVLVNTGDLFIDMMVLTTIEKSINSWVWFKFLENPAYRNICEFMANAPISDISKYYEEGSITPRNIFNMSFPIAKFFSIFVIMDEKEKMKYREIDAGTAAPGTKIDPFVAVILSYQRRVVGKYCMKTVAKLLGIDNFTNIIEWVKKNQKTSITDIM